MNTKKKFYCCLCIILVPIILCNLFLIIHSLIFPNKTISIFGFKTYVIISESMKPKINVGDIVIVKSSINDSNYKIGDVISYRENENIITHRIAKIKEFNGDKLSYITKGDNNNAEDSFVVRNNNIEGKVIRIIPKIGFLYLFIENNLFLLTVAILLFIFVFSNLEKIMKEKKMKDICNTYERYFDEEIIWNI